MTTLRDSGQPDPHERRDQEKLELHKHVAEILRCSPEAVIQRARANLTRWQESMGSQPYYEEWQALLERLTPEEIAQVITRDDEVGRRLRQATPFVGVVPPDIVQEIFGRV